MRESALYPWFVRNVWARHNHSRAVERGLQLAMQELEASSVPGLNVGCGAMHLHPRLIRVDVDPSVRPDSLSSAERLPFPNNLFSVAVSQEVLEHLHDPLDALVELARVLRPGGLLYVQTPFIIGYHAVPADYWRFTHEGLAGILEQAGLVVEFLEPAVGAGTALYRILAEFTGVVASRLYNPAYLPFKAIAAIVFAPLRWLDPWLSHGEQRWRIPGGVLAMARKPA